MDDLPQDLNGSGTYVPGTSNGGTPSVPGPAAAFNVFLPLSGFTLDVSFADLGGSGVDASTFSCTCSAAMGGVAAGQDLASLFTVTPLGARWTVDASHSNAWHDLAAAELAQTATGPRADTALALERILAPNSVTLVELVRP